MPVPITMIARIVGCLLVAWMLGGPVVATAQTDPPPLEGDADTTFVPLGTMDLYAWPDRDQIEAWGADLDDQWLPHFDSISIGYDYVVQEDMVDWTFELAWSPGAWVHTGAAIQPLDEVAGPGRLEQLYVIAEARVADTTRATALFAFEEMNVGPRPESVELAWSNVPLDELFDDLDAETARALLDEDPTFEIMEVERVQVLPPDETPVTAQRDEEARQERRPRADRPAPPRHRRTSSVFVIRTGYVFGGTRTRTVARPPAATPVPDGDGTTRGGRGEAQSEEGDSNGSDRRRSRSRDKDDDDAPSLGPAAMGAAAVVGLGAIVGGSIGISGSSDTPIGLTSGWTGRDRGLWLQAQVSGAVLTGEGTERLGVQLRGFTDVGLDEIQPALGVGLLFEQDSGTIVSRPIVAPGVVWNRYEMAFSVGYDLVNNAPQFGIVYNFRAQSSE